MVGDIIREFRTHFQSLGKDAQSVFDDSLIKDMAEHGEDIFKCAIYLFANYVDLATTFAEGHGGGGGGSDLLGEGRRMRKTGHGQGVACRGHTG